MFDVKLQDLNYSLSVGLVIHRKGIPNAYAKPMRFEAVRPGTMLEPTLECDPEEMDSLLQAFSDLAWERGIRPRQIEDQRNQVKAMEDHLSDLRRVSYKLLKIGE